MQAWQEVLKAALVGTERQAPAFTTAEAPVERLLAQLNAEEKERTLLRASGLLTVYRRAGYLPPRVAETLPTPAETEEKAATPFDVTQDLLLMLSGEYREALPEWLQAVAEKGRRIPEEHLAELLDYGRGHPEVRDSILPVLGKRGRWLAARNPDWKYALQISLFEIENPQNTENISPDISESAWQTGTKEERVALLHRLRRFVPASARTMVESTWTQDPPDERSAFLATFEAGLSMEDEPLLENALDDRRKEVRIAAQQLLLALPESRLCRRMWERVRPLVQLHKAIISSETIEVTLPQECDKAMIRDGIEPKVPSYNKIGEKTWWLKQLLSRVPLNYWSREWNRTPVQMVAANRSKEWTGELLEAWTSALPRSGDPEWATALFTRWIGYQPDKMNTDIEWSAYVPAAAYDAGVLRLLEKIGQSIQYGHPVYILLGQHKSPWSVELTEAFLNKLRNFNSNTYYIVSSMPEYAPFIPKALRNQFHAAWADAAAKIPYLQMQWEHYLALDNFRIEMRRKIDAAQEN